MPQAPAAPQLTPEGARHLSWALERLIARYTRLLGHVARRYGLPAEDVDEVIQEVRVRLWRARPEGETIATLGVSYVYRTAISAALAVVHRHRGIGGAAARRDRIDDREEDPELSTPASSGPERQLERSELSRAVAEEVGALADARRAAVKLYLAGYRREEIADMLGWSQAKARNLIYRGLADLRAALARRGIGPEELS
jgi:RNA polymerase sigma factor (sigma-70 family)